MGGGCNIAGGSGVLAAFAGRPPPGGGGSPTRSVFSIEMPQLALPGAHCSPFLLLVAVRCRDGAKSAENSDDRRKVACQQ